MENSFFMKTLKESMGNPGVKESSDGKALIFNGEIAKDIIGSLTFRPSRSTGSAWDFNIENQKIKHLDGLPNYFKKQPIEPKYNFTKTTDLSISYQDKVKAPKHDLNYLKYDSFSELSKRWIEKKEEPSKPFLNYTKAINPIEPKYDFTKTTELLKSYQDKIKAPKHDLDYLKYDGFSELSKRWSEKKEEASKSFKTSIIGTENYTTPYKCSNNSPMLSSLVNKLPVRPSCDSLGFGSKSSEDYAQKDYSNSKYLWPTIDTTPGMDVSENSFIVSSTIDHTAPIRNSGCFAGTFC